MIVVATFTKVAGSLDRALAKATLKFAPAIRPITVFFSWVIMILARPVTLAITMILLIVSTFCLKKESSMLLLLQR